MYIYFIYLFLKTTRACLSSFIYIIYVLCICIYLLCSNIITDRIRICFKITISFYLYLFIFFFFFCETNYYNRMRGYKENRCRCRRRKCPSVVVARQIICEWNRYDLFEMRNCFVWTNETMTRQRRKPSKPCFAIKYGIIM